MTTTIAPRAASHPSPRALAPEPPRTLAALIAAEAAAGQRVQALAIDAETLALILPQFDRVAATTTGPHAVLSERGGYGPVRLAGLGRDGPRGRIALRLATGRGEHVVLTAADPARRRPAGLHLCNADGLLLHRAEIAAPADVLLLHALCEGFEDGWLDSAPETAAGAPAAPSIPLIRRAQAEWRGMDAAAHMDDILVDGGAGRAFCLRHLGTELARPLAPALVAPFLRDLAAARLPFRRMVARPGCLQHCSGAVEAPPTGGPVIVLQGRATLFALDTSAIATAWLTRWTAADGGRMVELYDAEGQCLAVFGARDRMAKEAAAWEAALAARDFGPPG